MTTYSISAPDGQTYKIDGPEGASQEQVQQEVMRQFPQAGTAPTAPTAASAPATPTQSAPSTTDWLGRQLGLTARAGLTGITAVPAMMADFLGGAAGLAIGKTLKPTSQSFQELMTRIGLPEPQGGLERAVQAGAGSMAGTGVQAAASQGIKALSALSANMPQQVAASAAGGVAGQAAADVATDVTGNPLAGIAAGLAAGVLGGSAGSKAATRAQIPKSTVTIDDIKNRAAESYKAVADLGVAIKPSSVLSMLDNAENSLIKGNFNPLLDTHRPVSQVLDQLRGMANTPQVSFTKLEQMRSAAGGLKTSNEAATRKFAGDLVDEIDGYIGTLKGKDLIAGQGGIDQAVSSVQSARKDWRNMSKATILEDALNVAEARALNPISSENNLIRQQLLSLAANKKKMQQFSEVEQNAIKSVAKGGRGDAVLSLVARFNPERSQLLAAGSAYGATVNPLSMIIPATGFAADKYLGATRRSAMKGLISDVAGGNLTTPIPNYGWRGMLSGMPEPELENK